MDSIYSQRDSIRQWAQTDAWIVDRYQQLIAHKDWLELAKLDARLPLPAYAEVMKVQRLAFIHALASKDDIAEIKVLLDIDFRFWRVVLKNTDSLIGKMIAVAAIKNNFQWTNQFMLGLDENARQQVMLETANVAFTDEELSMRRCLIGEWFFAYNAVNPMDGSGVDNITGKVLQTFLYQKHDSLNMTAAKLNSIIEELDVPLVNFESTFEQYKKKSYPEKSSIHYFFHPYNIVGKILSDVVPADIYTPYVVRTKDLEAFRRGLLVSIAQMNNTAVDNSAYLSPYKSKPFVFSQNERSITVNGLGEDDRSKVVYFY